MANPIYDILRPAKVILPVKDNDGNDLAYSHMALRSTLCKVWGGCTVTDGERSWISDDGVLYQEPVKVYTVAMNTSQASAYTLRKIAEDMAAKCGQLAVYIETADGVVQFVKPNNHNATEAAQIAA